MFGLMLELFHPALGRRFVRPEANEFRAMPKVTVRDMVKAHFHHNLGQERLPLSRSLGRPAARRSGSGSGEARLMNERFKFFGQRRLIGFGDARREADMVQTSLVVVQTEQQGANVL